MWIQHIKVGKAAVTSLTDGRFRLDGGAMFGVVPKVLWEKLLVPDERNRIPLRINPLLIEWQGKRILIETGLFEGDAKFHDINGTERDETVFGGLNALGLTPEDIDIVINTHLHYDHAGRNTDSSFKPTFPNARYFVQKQEIEEAQNPHERNHASYFPVLWEPLLESGDMEILDGETEILPGLNVIPMPGHNLGMQVVHLSSEGKSLIYTADLMPTLHHAPYPYTMGYDLYPVTCLNNKKKFFPIWAEESAIIAPPHDPNYAFGTLISNAKGFKAVGLERMPTP